MKRLIVNGDDFGLTVGINRGIAEAHLSGVLTSTSLMVEMPASAAAADASRDMPGLSVGLHLVIEDGPTRVAESLERQIDRFLALVGRLPTHLDSHRDVHLDPVIEPYVADFAVRFNLPLRHRSTVRHITDFYGRWGGESHPEQLAVESLVSLLGGELSENFTELICHPGYADDSLQSSYRDEREHELRTLCDPGLRRWVDDSGISLVSFRDVGSRS